MSRSVLLGRVVAPGEPLFTDDDTQIALELQAEDDQRCPNGHPMDESVGDDGPSYRVAHFDCVACAVVASARRVQQKDMASHGEAGDDLLDGRYWVALPETEGGTS